jgi:L-seryl-tRNA(Ser) seleniumtransferase
MKRKNLRSVPAVEKVLQSLDAIPLPRPAIVAVVRRELAALRKSRSIPPFDEVVSNINARLASRRRSRIQPVINGTGIIIHTNLGRSPLGAKVIESLSEIGSNYNNLEYNLDSGERGSRASYLEHNLALLCGAESATVVNNCAAALVLILRHFTSGDRKEVIISRGELIQIGGGFRIPEILETSGAELREVGTTNKTSLSDYARAIGKQTALILKVHRSNFFMGGFVESPAAGEISALARKKRVPLVEDLGSGAVVETRRLASLDHEPMPSEVLRSGVDMVCFSGDKLLGGPQAGIIAGKSRYVSACKQNPFFRALRCDKLILGGLQTVVDAYLEAQSSDPAAANAELGLGVPTLQMIAVSNDELRIRAGRMVEALAGLPLNVTVGKGRAQVGGGTLPRAEIESVTVDILPQGMALAAFAARLRAATPPLIGVIGGSRFKLDLRTIFPRQDDDVVRVVNEALAGGSTE